MTLSPFAREMFNLKDHVQNTPDDQYPQIKDAMDIIGEKLDEFLFELRQAGLKTSNSDAMAEIETILLHYVMVCNQDIFDQVLKEVKPFSFWTINSMYGQIISSESNTKTE